MVYEAGATVLIYYQYLIENRRFNWMIFLILALSIPHTWRVESLMAYGICISI